ncbi:MAG: hypothetical protein QM752_04625 [Gammaproteobacteria bacterium]
MHKMLTTFLIFFTLNLPNIAFACKMTPIAASVETASAVLKQAEKDFASSDQITQLKLNTTSQSPYTYTIQVTKDNVCQQVTYTAHIQPDCSIEFDLFKKLMREACAQ